MARTASEFWQNLPEGSGKRCQRMFLVLEEGGHGSKPNPNKFGRKSAVSEVGGQTRLYEAAGHLLFAGSV
jgi:hypothetical protein